MYPGFINRDKHLYYLKSTHHSVPSHFLSVSIPTDRVLPIETCRHFTELTQPSFYIKYINGQTYPGFTHREKHLYYVKLTNLAPPHCLSVSISAHRPFPITTCLTTADISLNKHSILSIQSIVRGERIQISSTGTNTCII